MQLRHASVRMVLQAGLEPATCCLENSRSVQLSYRSSIYCRMDAKRIVRRMLEDGEAPDEFLGRNPDIYPKGEATHRFGFNLGEGNYSVGIAFKVNASSRQEAVHKANTFIQGYFFNQHRMGSIDLPDYPQDGVTVEDFRVYVDDDIAVTEEDIVSVDEIEHPPGWREIEGGDAPP